METRFKERGKIIDVVITGLAATLSVGTMLYGVIQYGLKDTWPELVLNIFYIACVVMIWMYFFNRLQAKQFNYWCTISVGITVMLRDILFPPQLAYYPISLACLTLSVALIILLTYFYARKDWKSYTKRSLYVLFIIDMVIAGLYHFVIFFNPVNEYTTYLLTEIWIRPTLIYGLVACFVTEKEDQ